jgi:fructokinase
MTERKFTVVGLGELLWDRLPSGKQLGGAPANFAYITNLLGDAGIPASRIGQDDLGNQILDRLRLLQVNSSFVQRDPIHPTGTVKVEVDAAGQARFEIMEPVAWDFLQWTNDWNQLAWQCDAVCFGSLAQRSPQSHATILNFVRATRAEAIRVFDVNLRKNFYSKEVIAESMKLASIVKLNHEELPRIMRLLALENNRERDAAKVLLSKFALKLVCVTRGDAGSLLLSDAEGSEHPGFKIKVADTVGAGDAFTAALVHGYVRRQPLAGINETANRVGAWVASQPGGMPTPKPPGFEQALADIA